MVLTQSLDAACPPGLRGPLARYLAGEISSEITLMHCVLRVGEAKEVIGVLKALAAAAPEVGELAHLAALAAANSDALVQVTRLVKTGLVDVPPVGSAGIGGIRAQFDRAVTIAPEASVALYSLGSAEILNRTTDEIVAHLTEWDLLRPDLVVLDIGCGIGRIELSLAPLVGAITAIDVSCRMLDEARRRCRGLANIKFQHCDGKNLAAFCDRSFDLILAVDSFPYMFAAGAEIAAQHVRDCARLLRSGGNLAIFNFSYRGDRADRRDVTRLADDNGFIVRRLGTRDFSLWDGVTFLLNLPARRE